MKKIEIYTDGACKGNPGKGGWGAILLYGKHRRELFGGEAHTTNNRMELMAAIKALEALTEKCSIDLYTDSNYVRQGITQWIHNWRKNNWRNSSKQPVKNAELWQQLDALAQQQVISWHWVKGHSGHPLNERADELANLGVDQGS